MEVRAVIEVIFLIVGVAVACLLGNWLHELTHAFAVWLLGGEVLRIELLLSEVYFRFDPVTPWKERLVYLAPAIVGFAALPVLLMAFNEVEGFWSYVWKFGWVFFTLYGGVEGELRITGIAQTAK